MDHYRLYFMTSIGGHIERFEPIEANSDQGAIEAAKLYQGPYPLELWRRDRRVQAFPACLRSAPRPLE